MANFMQRAAPGESLQSVRIGSACRRRGGRAAAVPPFSGPRSRAAVEACIGQPHQHRCALQSWGATANRACARGHHHRPDSSGVACHASACHPGARAGGLGYGRRSHSRWPQPAHEQTLLMTQRMRTENGAPRAWAGERTPSHLPCATLARSPRRRSATWPGPSGASFSCPASGRQHQFARHARFQAAGPADRLSRLDSEHALAAAKYRHSVTATPTGPSSNNRGVPDMYRAIAWSLAHAQRARERRPPSRRPLARRAGRTVGPSRKPA